MKQEIEDVNNGKLDGGSTLVPRIVFYQSCLKNIDSWGIWGLGVYTNVVSKQWYQASGNRVVASLTHSHNSYLQYWMLMGVVGLAFILSWFVYPVKSMICSKKYSFLALSLLVAFFIDSNFEVLLIVNDALPVVMFFLMMFYVFRDQFYAFRTRKRLNQFGNGFQYQVRGDITDIIFFPDQIIFYFQYPS